MFVKSYYTLDSVLRAIANGKDLNSEQVEVIRRKLERDDERAKQQAIMRKQRRESFEREIMEILESAPNTGFTATDIQFLIRDFVNRHITNQKVSAYLHYMVEDGKVAHKWQVNGNTSVFFCGGKLTELYGGRPIRYIGSGRFKSE